MSQTFETLDTALQIAVNSFVLKDLDYLVGTSKAWFRWNVTQSFKYLPVSMNMPCSVLFHMDPLKQPFDLHSNERVGQGRNIHNY